MVKLGSSPAAVENTNRPLLAGKNLINEVTVGEIFTLPMTSVFFDVFKAVDYGKSVACLFGNYAGDIMNVRMAVQEAEEEGIRVKMVIANNDVPSTSKEEREKRRDVAGEVPICNIGP